MATDLLKALIEKIDKKTYLSIIHCLAQKNKRMRIPGFSTLEKTPQALVINTAKTNKNFKDAFLDACVEVILDGQTIDYSISLTENKEKIDSVHWLGLAAAFLKRNDEQDVKEILGIISGCGAEKETEVKEEVKTDAKQEKREERFREKYLKAHAEVERLTALIETQKNELENAIAQRDNFAELVDGLKIEKENLLRMLSEKEEEIKQLRSFSAGAKEGDSKEQSPKASLTVKRIYAPNCQDLLGKYEDLRNPEFKIQMDPLYSYSWKKSSSLYEMWCFVKICRALADRYDLVGNSWNLCFGENLLFPYLANGEKMSFENDKLSIDVIFDQYIPTSVAKIKKHSNPFYTVGKHKRPDITIDIYTKKDDCYIGTIILECKYRKLSSFWYGTSDWSSKPQIQAYYTDNKSDLSYSGLGGDLDIRPIQAVIVLTPDVAAEGKQARNINTLIKTMKPDSENCLIDSVVRTIETMFEERYKKYELLEPLIATKSHS